MKTHRIVSTDFVIDSLQDSSAFLGGVWVARQDKIELFIQTTEERQRELHDMKLQSDALALVRQNI